MMTLLTRQLERQEIPQVWSIDRTELIEHLYLHQKGELVLSAQRQLFACCKTAAKEMGAKGFYISSIPSENTVHFYQHPGCELIAKPDPALFALEPEDIHFVFFFRD
ncbi:hypothetical protein [Morganella morganii]|uniref:hypothetical protein n=1 Tax=Morganella morganii TaxID=582 RepID=UPI003D6E653D